MYYTYNYKNQKWISSDADIYQPLFTPFSVKQKKAWCSVHKKWEACGKALNGKLFYECGCPIPSQFASVNNWTISKVETTEIPARDMVKLRVDLVLTSVSADGKKSYSYAYKTWAFYMKTGAIVPYESSEFLKKYRINLPESITAEVQALFSDYAKKLYGTGYTNSSCKKGVPALSDYVICPACPQVSDLQHFLGKQFTQIVDRKSSNPYQDICSYIHIKPFKRMRRIFDKNPLALPVYGVLKQWGFKDVNVMTKFLEDADLCQTYFKNIQYDTKSKRITMNDEDRHGDLFYFLNDYAKDIVTTVNRWCTESFIIQDEKTTMNRLIKAMKDGYHNFFDAAQMYYSRGAAVPETLRGRIRRECFTRQVHDALVEVFPRTYITKIEDGPIPYLESDKILNATEKDSYGNIYEFILPLDTNELYDLGEAMHNCVGTLYRNAALKRLSIIVGMKLNGKYQACIEIKTKDKEITQALGPCNRNLPAEIRNIIRKWALERDIGIATTHLRR